MPIEVGIWRLGEKIERIGVSSIGTESRLEDCLVADLSILSPGLILIGRQVPTGYGKLIDLLAIDADGRVWVIELKRDRTPREVVAQLLDYGSWVQEVSYEEIRTIHENRNGGAAFEKSFAEAFGTSPPEEINESHRLVVVSSELDPSTERIINYLSDTHGVPINAVFFRCFRDGDCEYITRTWLIDPDEAEAKSSRSGKKSREPWNGRDFYVGIGEGEHRNWDDCRRYGFVSGGQGRWYSQTLSLLAPGSRVFVNIPKTGYVGVGIVKDPAVPVKDFKVTVAGKEMNILDAPLQAPRMSENANDLRLSEYAVRVEWLKTVPREEAYWEKGLFAIQHTACRMSSSFTIDRVAHHFGLDA